MQVSWLKGGREVGQIEPVPRRDENVLGLDVAVVDVPGMAIPHDRQQLEGNPLLLNVLQEGSSAMTLVGNQMGDGHTLIGRSRQLLPTETRHSESEHDSPEF